VRRTPYLNVENSNMMGKEGSLQKVLDSITDGRLVFGTSFAIKKDSDTWIGISGNITKDQPYFIASVTKLFTTAIILRLKSDGKLSLDDKITYYFEDDIMQGLHLYRGSDYSNELTIKNLLSHTSGLPDYFQDKGEDGKSLEEEWVNGCDQYWSFQQLLARIKKMKPLFPPGAKKRAHYSDANFQLLGKLIEVITKKSYSENCDDFIFKPLGLSKTYVYKDPTDRTPIAMYYKSNELHIPRAMTSTGPEGGMVSTSEELLTFIEAFFSGNLFPVHYINDLQEWNNIFFPLQAGIGIHKFQLPWLFNPTGRIPIFIGHSGISGALAYHSPKEKLFVVGTVNQVAHPELPFKIMIRLVQTLTK
jgi:D-alanyl-D-alanine carboxypeptidase